MFREMRRFKQQLTKEECIEILKKEPRGVLSVLGDDGYPYGIVINQWYDEKTGKLYFHGAKEGHKIDALRRCDKVSFCVHDEGYREGDDWPLHIKSVVVFGRMKEVTDSEKIVEICTHLCGKFSDDQAYVEKELSRGIPRGLCLELTPEHISGKLVKESWWKCLPNHIPKQVANIKKFAKDISTEELESYLKKYYNTQAYEQYKSLFRKLIALYDLKKYF